MKLLCDRSGATTKGVDGTTKTVQRKCSECAKITTHAYVHAFRDHEHRMARPRIWRRNSASTAAVWTPARTPSTGTSNNATRSSSPGPRSTGSWYAPGR